MAECWAPSPAERPDMVVVADRLEALFEAERSLQINRKSTGKQQRGRAPTRIGAAQTARAYDDAIDGQNDLVGDEKADSPRSRVILRPLDATDPGEKGHKAFTWDDAQRDEHGYPDGDKGKGKQLNNSRG